MFDVKRSIRAKFVSNRTISVDVTVGEDIYTFEVELERIDGPKVHHGKKRKRTDWDDETVAASTSGD